ncbi:hypothetical protein M413DRAFT_441861 [Hebeloma cylindrosporum]|uniref:Uncharacterized protein n=1 Tax=Hebeloma cylindrosporum TaxID=76867 RepID=A0A0C3C8N5_HEBCY|nr:hypothetical protein M413DRAFT_441861 [Hebeloma cylindrosporum h7]
MSLARRALLVSVRSKPILYTQARAASSSSHDHHDHHHEDSTVYPAESFGTPFWRNVLLLSIAGVAAVQFLPEAREDVYLTRWIAMYIRPHDYWINARYAAAMEQTSHNTLTLHDAKKPRGHIFRYPQSMVQASPFLNGVGMDVVQK